MTKLKFHVQTAQCVPCDERIKLVMPEEWFNQKQKPVHLAEAEKDYFRFYCWHTQECSECEYQEHREWVEYDI